MPSTSTTESFLAVFAGRTRAAAMMGDLIEMAATRGRRWFWIEYARTLASLTWRIVLGLFVAEIGRELVFNLAGLYFHLAPAAWRTEHAPRFLWSTPALVACVMSTLWFALPFAAVRYGVRDRFVQLTFAMAIGTTVTFMFIPWASILCALATAALGVAAMFSSTWRKPLEVLVWTGGVGILVIGAVSAARLTLAHGSLEYCLLNDWPMLAFQTTLVAVAIVCSRVHGWLLGNDATNA